MKQRYIINAKFGLMPTWRSLVRAVENRAGGADPALAKEIAAEHPSKFIWGIDMSTRACMDTHRLIDVNS